MSKFRKELEILINKQSRENRSDTPDWILARFLDDCLIIFENATNLRSEFYNVKKIKGNKEIITK